MNYISITGEFCIILRKAAITQRGITMETILNAMETKKPMDQNDDLISFGPHFGQEALEIFIDRLKKLNLEYYDDFFDFVCYSPPWIAFKAFFNA